MVQILPPKKDFLSRLVSTTAQTLPQIGDALTRYQMAQQQASQQQSMQNQQMQQGRAASQFYGQDISSLDPDIQKQLVLERAKELAEARQLQQFPELTGQPSIQPSSVSSKPSQGTQPTPMQDVVSIWESIGPIRRGQYAKVRPKEAAQLDADLKARRSPKGGPTFEPMPLEYRTKLNDILEDNPNVSAKKFAQLADDSGVPRGWSNSYFETIRRERELGSKEKIEIHKLSADYYKNIREGAQQAESQLSAIKDIMNVVDPASNWKSISNWARSFGEPGRILANAFQTAEQGQMQAALPNLIEGFRQLFGVRITDADLKILLDKLPDIGKDAGTNKAILNVLEKYAKRKSQKGKIAREIMKEYDGFRPSNFENLVEDRYVEWNQKQNYQDAIKNAYGKLQPGYVWALDPEGKLAQIPKENADEARQEDWYIP